MVHRVSCTAAVEPPAVAQRPDKNGRYGKFGGKYVPETLIPALQELEQAYAEARADPAFQVCAWVGRPAAHLVVAASGGEHPSFFAASLHARRAAP